MDMNLNINSLNIQDDETKLNLKKNDNLLVISSVFK